MNVMMKMARALKDSKISVMRINDGQENIAERSFIFFHEGKRIPVTIQLKKERHCPEAKINIILWETDSKISGKLFKIEEAPQHIPGFNSNHPLFNSELNAMKRKTDGPTLENRRKVALLYADE
jgi:hypothetical protein